MGRIEKLKRQLINEANIRVLTEQTSDKIAILIDGTSSAGKSMTANLLDAVPFYKATDPNQWVVIDSDHFSNDSKTDGGAGEERRLKLDNPNIKDWAKGNDYGIVSGLYRKDGKDVPENPYESEYIEGTDPRVWYMAQEFKTGGWKKVIFDDIGNGILNYVPNTKNILLHAPISVLMQNIDERNKKGKQPRKHEDVLDQYLGKYEATKTPPDGKNIFGHSVPINRKDLEDKLLSSGISEKYVQHFFKKLGMGSDGDHYIKVKDKYLKPGVLLINVDDTREEYLKQFKDIVS